MIGRRTQALAAACALAAAAVAGPEDPNRPQIDLKVTGPAQRRIPIAVTALERSAASGAEPAAATMRSVMTDDLAYSGLFNVLAPALYEKLTASAGRVPLRDLAALGAQGVVAGTVEQKSSELVVEGLLYDSRSEALIAGKRYRGTPELARDIAHRIANDVMIAYTGRTGVSLTRLVLVGRARGGKEIYVMDYDGHDLRQITNNGSINVSPAWSPDGRRLAFVSYKQGNPKLFVYNGEDGSTVPVTPPGSELCVAPDWSPDGGSIAFASSRAGDSEIFVVDLASGRTRQITFNRGTDTSPAWSPSGREIAFTSDRSGRPHVYVMDAEGANLRRVTTEGEYNDSAAWSPSGDRLAYASRIDGRFDILVLDLPSGAVSRLTQNAGNNESPRWSPDGRHIVFASNRTGSYRLYTMDADGNRQESIDTAFEATMPDWSR